MMMALECKILNSLGYGYVVFMDGLGVGVGNLVPFWEASLFSPNLI